MIHRIERSIVLPLSRAEVFPFYADAGNLERITPPELKFRILTPQPIEMREGALIDYRLQLFGVPFKWRTCITRWQPETGFTDEQIRGPYAKWVHRHDFREVPGGTEIVDVVDYALPLSPLGDVAFPIVRRQLDRIFDHRHVATQEAFGVAEVEAAA